MATKSKVKVEVEQEVEKVETPATEPAKTDKKSIIRDELAALVKNYNESMQFGEFKVMRKLDESIKAKLEEYTKEAKSERFKELAAMDNPMVEIARDMTFSTLKVVDKEEDDGPVRVIESAEKAIDPLELHKRVEGGIGADHMWPYMVERLNMLFTAATAKDLGLDAKQVKNTMLMHEEAEKLELAGDKKSTDAAILADVQKTIDAMLGAGYTATPAMVQYLRKVHERGGKASLTVKCSNHAGMRSHMVVLCHAAVTGDPFILDYKQKKSK